MAFERSDDYMCKITMNAIDRHVAIDCHVVIQKQGSKLKAYCKETDTFLQFPRDIRKAGETFFADVVKASKSTGTVFYRAYPGSIRRTKNGDPIA
jgi:hypothetical protein